MSTLDKPGNLNTQALGSLAVGVAAGMVVADRLGRPARGIASLTLLSVGLVATVPFLKSYVSRQINGPTNRFGSRKTLSGIRQSGVSDFSTEATGENARELVSA